MKSKKLKRFLTLVLATIMSLMACSRPPGTQSSVESGSTSVPENAAYRETLHITVIQRAPSSDLYKNSSLIAKQTRDSAVWEKLVTLNSKAEAIPELVEKYGATNGGKTLTFMLRKGVKFHGDSEMTADDIVAPINRWIEGFNSTGMMVGDTRFVRVDDYTVEIDGKALLTLLLAMIADVAQLASITTTAICKNEDTNEFLKDYIGIGPCKLPEWKQDQYIKLERFDDYVACGTKGTEMDGWNGYRMAPTKALQFDLVVDRVAESAGLEAGQYDVVFSASYDDYTRLESNPNLTTISSQVGIIALTPSHKQSIASNQHFRTAVNTALGYDELLAAPYGKAYEFDFSYMDASQPFWASEVGKESYSQKDLEKARKVLTGNGYKGELFTILVAILNRMDNIGIAIRSQLEKIGTPVKLTVVDRITLTEYRKDPTEFGMYITTFAEVPVSSLRLYYDAAYPGQSDDERLQTLFKEITSALTLEEVRTRWDGLQGYSWEHLPIIHPGHHTGMFVWQKNVTGISMYSGRPKFWNTGIVEF